LRYTSATPFRISQATLIVSNDLVVDEGQLLAALKARDESAFVTLVRYYHGPLLRLAMVHCGSHAVAEEIVQETWLGVLQGIDRFEGRASFKTWLFRILVNRARTRSERESRTVPFSELVSNETGGDEPAVSPDRFLGADHPEWPHHWSAPPSSWGGSPDEALVSKEARELVAGAISGLPPAQRQVITLRDVEGWSAEEVCNALDISETNQRVLLHRARSRVRGALEGYFGKE
jgi:RNA polymerase sigma-70 factor (ECF subfamily)